MIDKGITVSKAIRSHNVHIEASRDAVKSLQDALDAVDASSMIVQLYIARAIDPKRWFVTLIERTQERLLR